MFAECASPTHDTRPFRLVGGKSSIEKTLPLLWNATKRQSSNVSADRKPMLCRERNVSKSEVGETTTTAAPRW